MAKYRRKSVVVDAEQWFPDRIIEGVTNRGSYGYVATGGTGSIIDSGNWVVMEENGVRSVCLPERFLRDYELIELDK